MSEVRKTNLQGRERAQKMLVSIASLKKCEAFSGYFLDRIKEKMATALNMALTDSDQETREKNRIVYLTLQEVLDLVPKDEHFSMKVLE